MRRSNHLLNVDVVILVGGLGTRLRPSVTQNEIRFRSTRSAPPLNPPSKTNEMSFIFCCGVLFKRHPFYERAYPQCCQSVFQNAY